MQNVENWTVTMYPKYLELENVNSSLFVPNSHLSRQLQGSKPHIFPEAIRKRELAAHKLAIKEGSQPFRFMDLLFFFFFSGRE